MGLDNDRMMEEWLPHPSPSCRLITVTSMHCLGESCYMFMGAVIVNLSWVLTSWVYSFLLILIYQVQVPWSWIKSRRIHPTETINKERSHGITERMLLCTTVACWHTEELIALDKQVNLYTIPLHYITKSMWNHSKLLSSRSFQWTLLLMLLHTYLSDNRALPMLW